MSAAAMMAERTRAHYAIHFANRAMVERDWADPRYVEARAALDGLMLILAKAKWLCGAATGDYLGFVDRTSDASASLEASQLFQAVVGRAEEIRLFLTSGAPLPRLEIAGPEKREGVECKFYDDVPLIPTTCPIVVLSGSNYDMGRQYAEQVLDIYGPFIFAWHAEWTLSPEQIREIQRWEAELLRFTPEILDFARGWSDGAIARGVAMDYWRALAIWTGVRAPAAVPNPMGNMLEGESADVVSLAYLGAGSETHPLGPAVDFNICSGACAWGKATTDGALVIGSTTDHDCTFQATIVAFPDKGNNFIYTPFSANGFIPVLGGWFMAGHPGMNDKGLAYVHHGGTAFMEPADQWGYGVRRGAITFHLLQFADTARAARDMIMAHPVGDGSTILGQVGGLWADATYGFCVEQRTGAPHSPSPVIRDQTFDRDGAGYDFLYANNNPVSPKLWMVGHLEDQAFKRYELEAGWFATEQDGPPHGLSNKNSAARGRYHHRMLLAGNGSIDLDYMTMMYRQSGHVPAGRYSEVVARYQAGEEWNASVAHRANAFTAIAKPNANGAGSYRACVGPANRAVNCREPGHGYYYYDETNAFWEIDLAPNPAALLRQARSLAEERIVAATDVIEGLDEDFAGLAPLTAFLRDARLAYDEGAAIADGLDVLSGDAALAETARGLRRFTHAQVRSNQVDEAINTPPASPDMLEADRGRARPDHDGMASA